MAKAHSLMPWQFYPWQHQAAQQWLRHKDRMAHAWLVHGVAGIGKVQFAKAGAAALLCEQPQQGLACGQCSSCQWVQSDNHPDLRLIRPDSMTAVEQPEAISSSRSKTPSTHIRIEQLRDLSTWFTTATHRGGYRVAVLYPADRLNGVSANALLKVVEEPPANTIIVLVVDHYERLLPTLLSRCQRVALPVPPMAQSVPWLRQQLPELNEPETWLAATGGAPVAALQAAQNNTLPYPSWLASLCQLWAQGGGREQLLSFAHELEAMPTAQWVDVLQRVYIDLQLHQAQVAPRYYPALAASLLAVAQRTPAVHLQQQWKWLLAQQRDADHPLNNKLLVHTALERMAH